MRRINANPSTSRAICGRSVACSVVQIGKVTESDEKLTTNKHRAVDKLGVLICRNTY